MDGYGDAAAPKNQKAQHAKMRMVMTLHKPSRTHSLVLVVPVSYFVPPVNMAKMPRL
jgi:hypothetical protein